METKYQIRKRELLDECTIAPEIFEQVTQRLEQFMAPYVEHLARREQIQHSQTFMQGLLSDLARKNVESIAYRFGQARMPLQWFIGVSDWDDRALRQVLVDQVGQHLGEADGVLVFDPSAFPKSGGESVGGAWFQRNAWRICPWRKRPASGSDLTDTSSTISSLQAGS